MSDIIKLGQFLHLEEPGPVTRDNPVPVQPSGKTVSTATVTIDAAASLSNAADLETNTLMAIIMPAAWDAADLTFEVSHNGTDWIDLYNEFGEALVTVADTDRYIHLTPAEWVGVRHVKVRSGTSAAAVAQAAERVITLVVKEL